MESVVERRMLALKREREGARASVRVFKAPAERVGSARILLGEGVGQGW